jgi:hypothetical protein
MRRMATPAAFFLARSDDDVRVVFAAGPLSTAIFVEARARDQDLR